MTQRPNNTSVELTASGCGVEFLVIDWFRLAVSHASASESAAHFYLFGD